MTSYHEVDERDGFVQGEEEVHLGEAKIVEKKRRMKSMLQKKSLLNALIVMAK